MAGLVWPGSEVLSAADRQRTALRQAGALAAFTATGLGWVAVARADSLALVVTILAAAALVVELAWALVARERLLRGADELILAGFLPGDREDRISAAVRRRTAQLCGSRRRDLVAQIRYQATLAGAPHAPLRAPVARHPALLERIAAGMGDAQVDPRAVILLCRLVSEPAPETIGRLRTGRTLEQRLLEVLSLLHGGPA